MTAFTPIVVGNDRPISVTLSNNESKFDDIDTMMTAIQVCLDALDPLGPSGPNRPDGTSTGIPLVFKTVNDAQGNAQKVQADVSSTTAFQQSLNGLTILAGEAVIASTANPNAFGTSVGKGDALFALVDNPAQDITNTTDWLRLEGDDSYSITLSERQLLDTFTETDTVFRVVDASTEVTVTFYLLDTAATVDGDLTGGQVGSFTQTTDNQIGILYVRFPSSYQSSTGANNLYVEITNANGTVARFTPLSSYTERTDLLVAGDDVFESDDQPRDMEIGYLANQTIRLWRTRTSQEWASTFSLNLIPSIRDGSIDITKLSEETQTLLRSLQEHILDQEARLSSVEGEADNLHPLIRDVQILTDLADIYDPARVSASVREVPGYTLMADFRGTMASQRYESSAITYTAGTGVSEYEDLTNDVHRCVGFRVSAAADQTLLSVGTGVDAIPLIDITAGGNLRVNDYTPASTADQVITNDIELVSSPTSGTGTLTIGGAASTYTIPDYPANTREQSRTAVLNLEVLVGGSDTLASAFVDIAIPDTVVARAADTVDHTFFTGWPHNRNITCTIGFEYRVSGLDLVLDLTLETAPSDVTLRVNNVQVGRNYTATAIIARVDDFQTFSDGLGAFTFSGDHEFLFAFHPFPDNRLFVVPVAINTSTGAISELNDITIKQSIATFDKIEVPDTIEFRTFLPNHFLNHSDLANLLGDRTTRFVYGLAREESVTGHAFTEAVDFNAGSTINGTAFSRDISSTAIGGTGNEILTLPADYTDFEKVSYAVVEDGGQTTNHHFMTRWLEANATLSPVRVSGNDTATWNRAARTMTLDSTADTWHVAVLETPRLS